MYLDIQFSFSFFSLSPRIFKVSPSPTCPFPFVDHSFPQFWSKHNLGGMWPRFKKYPSPPKPLVPYLYKYKSISSNTRNTIHQNAHHHQDTSRKSSINNTFIYLTCPIKISIGDFTTRKLDISIKVLRL